MTYTVYVLQSDCNRLYVGVTCNLNRRLAEHRKGCRQSRKLCKDPSTYKVVRAWSGLSLEDGCRLEVFLQRHSVRTIWSYVKAYPTITPEFRALWAHRRLESNYDYIAKQLLERTQGAMAADPEALLNQVF